MARAAAARGGRWAAACGIALAVILAAAPGAWSLPDHRGYELVSPVDKSSGDVMPDSGRVRAAQDDVARPMAVSFASLRGFGDVQGTGVATEYMSVRAPDGASGSQGWGTHAITPQQQPLSFYAIVFGDDPEYDGEFSSDLSTGIFRAWSLLAPAPNVSRVENIYLRDDLRLPGAGSYELLSDAPAPIGSDTDRLENILSSPVFVSASADFGHVFFESYAPRTADAPAGLTPEVYEWDHGVVRLASVLPDGSVPSNAVLGQGASNGIETPHVVSRDGSKAIFMVQTGICGAGSSPCGALYQRIDHGETVQVNASERTDCAGDATCGGDGVPDPEPDPGGAQPAIYWDASVDGGRIFFTSTEALTDDAPLNGDRKVYMYDASRPASDPHNLVYISKPEPGRPSSDAQGVIGAGADGRTAYFTTAGQLVAGGPSVRGRGLYWWHDDGSANGALSFIGDLTQTGDAYENMSGSIVLSPLRSRITPDGRRLLFSATSGDGLTGADHGSCPTSGTANGQCRELYLYNADAGTLVCISCDPLGSVASSDAFISVRAATGAASSTSHLSHPISDDGSRVFFTTADPLVPEDVNRQADVYEWESASGRAELISRGTGTSPSYFMDASAGGGDVFFTTRDALVGWDSDRSVDLYDARVNGGFPEPAPSAEPCAGEGCRGEPSAPPPARMVGSMLGSGSGNVAHAHARTRKQRRSCKRRQAHRRAKARVRCHRRKRRGVKRARTGTRRKRGRR